MAKITRAEIDKLQAPSAGLAYLWDSSLPGFGVRVTSAGVKSFVLRYRIAGRQRIKTLGRCGVLELTDARAQAQQRIGMVYSGADPFAGHGVIETVNDLAKAHQEGRKSELKPKTLAGYDSLWQAHILPLLGARTVDSLSDDDVNQLRKRLAKKPTTFNRCCALIVTALKWNGAAVEAHPFQKAARFRERGRDRILADDENQRLYESFAEYKAQRKAGWRYVDLFALLLLTALRRDEWRLGRWEWLRWDDGVYTLPDNKTGGRVVYVPAYGMDILRQRWADQGRPKFGYIFPGVDTKKKPLSWTWRTWDAMRTALKITGFTIHDMRRTAGSFAHGKAGLSQRQVADFLGHKKIETSSRYIHDKEKRAGAESAAAAMVQGWKKSPIPKHADS